VAILDLYRRSVRAFADRVDAVGADQWTNPTPCSEWDVRTLINHIVYEQRWSVPLFAGATIAEVGDQFEGDLLGSDPLASVRASADEALAAVADPAVLDRTVHLSVGDTPAAEYLYQLFADHLVHGWDLAVGIDGDRRLDPELVRECLQWFAGQEDSYRRAGAIGPAGPLPDDPTDQDRLIAAFGRDPRA
jgi:uncharacterized protein (TIGR03086 family)